MKQYRVTLRTELGTNRIFDVMAESHEEARERAHRQSGGLLVLSTEFIG